MRRGTHWLGLVALVAIVALAVVAVVVAGRLATSGTSDGEVVDVPGGPDDRPAAVPDDAVVEVVARVVDGDTIRVVTPGGDEERVRLLNVDAPELQHPERGRECGGRTATALVDELLPAGSTVWLAPGRRERDRFDRRLGYAFAADGADVQARLVEEGLATVLVVAGDDRFAAPLRRLEASAREAGAGIWGPGCLP